MFQAGMPETFPLGNGDRTVLYTDGILEALNSSKENYGTDRFGRILWRTTGISAPIRS
jgi:serine phosphatase RsbU (regulator of sigma subunit)